MWKVAVSLANKRELGGTFNNRFVSENLVRNEDFTLCQTVIEELSS